MALKFGLKQTGGTIGPQAGGTTPTFLPAVDSELDKQAAPAPADKAAIAVLKAALAGIAQYGVDTGCHFADALQVSASDNAAGAIVVTLQVQMVPK